MSMKNQQGAVLIVSLVMLLLITAIALSTLTGSTFQTIMTSNAQQRESMLRVAESAAEQPLSRPNLTSAFNTYLRWNGMGESVRTKQDRFFSIASANLTTEEPDATMSAQVMYVDHARPENQDPKLFWYYIYESQGFAHSSEAATAADAKVATQVIQGVARLDRAACGDSYDPC